LKAFLLEGESLILGRVLVGDLVGDLTVLGGELGESLGGELIRDLKTNEGRGPFIEKMPPLLLMSNFDLGFLLEHNLIELSLRADANL